MKLGKALHLINQETKAIDQTLKYIKCELEGRYPKDIPLEMVDIIAYRYGDISLNAETKWESDMLWDDAEDTTISNEKLLKLESILKIKKKELYGMKHEVLSHCDRVIVKSIQYVNGRKMKLVLLDGFEFHDFLEKNEIVDDLKKEKYRKPNRSWARCVQVGELKKAIEIVKNYLIGKEGEADEEKNQ